MSQQTLHSSPAVPDPHNNEIEIPMARIANGSSRSILYYNESIIVADVDEIVEDDHGPEPTPIVIQGHMLGTSLTEKKHAGIRY